MSIPTLNPATDHSPPATDPQGPKLLDKLRVLLETRRYRPETVARFVEWNRQFILFHDKRHPATLGREHIENFLDHVARTGYGADLQAQARQALAFLYREVLGQVQPWPEIARVRPGERVGVSEPSMPKSVSPATTIAISPQETGNRSGHRLLHGRAGGPFAADGKRPASSERPQRSEPLRLLRNWWRKA